ncbi:205_t:CDS:1 [Ambispora gerdemannii]|uniref:205_t:CDS:1 n=1 Tax=Ambispora gerdemannii TaxID=144530 RepID=A0A9N8W3C2_9GLOM|nr:205_t:CDS:1 [Ambispora gerdemannii]
MKNLILILVLAVVAFSNFAFADEYDSLLMQMGPDIAKRSPLEARAYTCPSGYSECSDGDGCCPIGTVCQASGTCSGGCGPNPVSCGFGKCCKQGQICGSDGYCKQGSSLPPATVAVPTVAVPTYSIATIPSIASIQTLASVSTYLLPTGTKGSTPSVGLSQPSVDPSMDLSQPGATSTATTKVTPTIGISPAIANSPVMSITIILVVLGSLIFV